MATTKHGQDEGKGIVGTAGGGTAGALAGAAVGAAVGGPVGAAVGAGIGAVTGSAAGAAVDYQSHEPELRKEFESSSASSSHSWADVSPAYRYGWEHYDRPEYRGKSWSQVHSDLKKGWTGGGNWSDYESHVKSAWERRAKLGAGTVAGSAATASSEAVVPIVEEEMQVGKRKVEKGGVQVKTTVTETPVEADVHLHEERVTVKRRAVDRPVTDADVAAFQEGTIEMKETAEEAVVSKRARVIEEVVLSKEGLDKKHTVRDKVRKTDVDVQELDTPAVVTDEGFETFRPTFEKHYKSHYGKAKVGHATLEEFTPAYRFGHTLATDSRYGSGEWATVEPEARKHWEAKNEGTWEEFKDAIHHAWDKARGKA